jgi:hypothetical protein
MDKLLLSSFSRVENLKYAIILVSCEVFQFVSDFVASVHFSVVLVLVSSKLSSVNCELVLLSYCYYLLWT